MIKDPSKESLWINLSCGLMVDLSLIGQDPLELLKKTLVLFSGLFVKPRFHIGKAYKLSSGK